MRHDFSRFEEHRRHHDARRARVDSRGQALGERVHRPRRDARHVESFLGQSIDLPPDRVELAVRRHDPRTIQEWQRRQPAGDELVRVLSECDVVGMIAEQPRKRGLHLRCLLARPRPLVVHELRRIEPRALLRLEADVGPRLVRVARQQQALRDAEAGIVCGERVRSHVERRYRLARISQRSGNRFRPCVVRRYAAPREPPVPGLLPIVRSTILT